MSLKPTSTSPSLGSKPISVGIRFIPQATTPPLGGELSDSLSASFREGKKEVYTVLNSLWRGLQDLRDQ